MDYCVKETSFVLGKISMEKDKFEVKFKENKITDKGSN